MINKDDNKNKNKNLNNIKEGKDINKGKDLFIFGNRNDKIKKLKDYDKKYIDKITEIF